MTAPAWHPDGVTFSPCSGNNHPSPSSQLLPAPPSPGCHGKQSGLCSGFLPAHALHVTTKALTGMSAGRNLGAFSVRGAAKDSQPPAAQYLPKGHLTRFLQESLAEEAVREGIGTSVSPLAKCLRPGRLWNQVREVSGGLGTIYPCLPRAAAQQE